MILRYHGQWIHLILFVNYCKSYSQETRRLKKSTQTSHILWTPIVYALVPYIFIIYIFKRIIQLIGKYTTDLNEKLQLFNVIAIAINLNQMLFKSQNDSNSLTKKNNRKQYQMENVSHKDSCHLYY